MSKTKSISEVKRRELRIGINKYQELEVFNCSEFSVEELLRLRLYIDDYLRSLVKIKQGGA